MDKWHIAAFCAGVIVGILLNRSNRPVLFDWHIKIKRNGEKEQDDAG